VETFAKVWLFTLAEADWRPTGGTRVATIGPLGVRPEGRYTASYMQAATSPGFQTDIHQHGGQEALFTLSGEVCVETPDGKLVGRAGGEPLLINRDVPMQLTSVGSELRRSLVSDSSRRSTAVEGADPEPLGAEGPVHETERLKDGGVTTRQPRPSTAI
jgi:quercetin dioxygenase-like cupin family protein